jgi:hypothetical protein
MSETFHPTDSGDRTLRIDKFPVEGINMIKLFQKHVKLQTKNKRYTYREALYDLIEYGYTHLVEKKVKRKKL